MRNLLLVTLFLFIACEDTNHQKLGSLTIALNTSSVDTQSTSLNRSESNQLIAPIELAVIRVGGNSPININFWFINCSQQNT